MTPHDAIRVYVEVGAKRTFAGALEWPGWERSGKDEATALDALVVYAPRYRATLGAKGRVFIAAADVDDFEVTEHVRGNSTTDFGAPGVPPAADSRPLDGSELDRLAGLLRASWRALDRAADAARGKTLAKGPRGGGRELDQIVRHVHDSQAGYLRALGRTFAGEGAIEPKDAPALQRAVLAALRAAPRIGPAPRGPRGGKRWTVRYFVRRSAWHALDHAWEIEDRSRA